MKTRIKILLFCISSIVFISCDRVTKDLAKEHLKNKPAASYFHDSFRLDYTENTGAAMSIGDSLPKTVSFWVLGIVPLLLLLTLFWFTIRHSAQMNPMKVFSIALLFSGGIGNIADRLLYDRHVTDFMNLGIQNIRTGIFNFADVCVTAGAIGLAIFFRNNQKPVPA